jgi:fido (protein-threonine AMPylation protein)
MTPLEAGLANGDGSTDLSPEDFDELIPDWVNTRADLNVAESESILSARIGYFSRTLPSDKILDDLFLRKLHKDMFA